MVGQTISHYRILEKLGEGGMGSVYKAEDVRLRRTVALKFLPERFSLTQDDRDRFLREAQAAAALDHPNICTIYEVDEDKGRPFLAMAYIDGESLDHRIEQAPIELREALEIARQAADGLRAAHAKGIVHRDIKSSNLMLVRGGSGRPQVKLLDFGLAQLAGRSKLTRADSVMGTVAYMSPEQTQGETVDLRTDVWSLGVVLYEMIAGELPFKGHYDQAMLYSILNEEPKPLTSLRSRLPVELDWIVDKCLAKDPAERYQSMDDLILDLTTLEKKLTTQKLSIHQSRIGAAPTPASPASAPDNAARWKRLAGLAAVAAVVFAGLAAASWFEPEQSQAPVSTLRFDINLPGSLSDDAELRSLAISPDGRRIAFSVSGASRRLWLRDLNQPSAYALDGTDGASDPFWSPDSQTIGYRAENKLLKVAAGGGPSSTLCELPSEFFGGASFTSDGEQVVFTSGPPLRVYEVSARGGQPVELAEPNSEGGRGGFATHPTLIGKDALLFSSRTPQGEQVGLRKLSGDETIVLADGGAPFLTSNGYILYHTGRSASEIWALPFSASKLEATGDAFPVAQSGMLPSASRDGTLVYMADSRSGPARLSVHSRTGERLSDLGREQSSIRDPAVSRDGRWAVWSGEEGTATDLYLYDLERNTRTRLTNTSSEAEVSPHWSPDGSRIAYTLIGDGASPLLAVRRVDGTGEVQTIQNDDGPLFPLDWGPNGRILARTRSRGRGPGHGGLVQVELQANGASTQSAVLDGELGVSEADISPDGKFVALESRMAEESQIVVRAFPSGDRRWQVTEAGGESPRWSRGGKELIYRSGGRLLAVQVERRGDELFFSSPTELFSDPTLLSGPRRPGYAVTPDGDHILLPEPVGRPTPPTIRVALHWLADYKR
ncbi:MAG: serine/threonine-protein kinase [Bryobacterales bacterium]|nr:serine/threonine-protein kinase [Bryobacterales bacterium]